jgi:hypothetical protein
MRLQAVDAAAAAHPPVGADDLRVAQLAGHAAEAPVQPPVEHEPHADAGGDLHEDQVVVGRHEAVAFG